MKNHDLPDLLHEYGRHLETQMTPLDLEQVSVYQAQPIPRAAPNRRTAVWSVAAVISVSILATAALLLARTGGGDEVAEPVVTPTTAADVETMTDLEIIEAGVAAFYSGRGERAMELFELPDLPDVEIRRYAAYQAAIGGRLTLSCDEQDTPGVFTCNVPYQNAMTDAIGFSDIPGDTIDVVVEDGAITDFAFPEHTFILAGMGNFLAMEGRLDGYEECVSGPPIDQSCASIQMENLAAWAEWREELEPTTLVEFALESWYGGDCPGARLISNLDPNACSTPDTPSQTIEYESILGADVSLEGCETVGFEPSGSAMILSCEVYYSNAMNTAVGRPPSVTVREFGVHPPDGPVRTSNGMPWYQGGYPEDTDLRQSFRLFAESGELQDEYVAADCAKVRTPECANMVMDNLDEWAVWYEANS